ncbi:vacuolar protein sorting-associated protein 9A-like isoform X1 [Iris pallida]|nr:vacuolar protein sorting-associated protein 9A-like isoform X1 [Iris pallida]KAJ6839610.1 vacuolar protein sorting-associated protein 9A-like isoform X1 [Iris pallida]
MERSGGGGSDAFGSSMHDFLERMRHPSAADLVKSIKSFIVSILNKDPDPEKDSAAVQEFLANMEVAFRSHTLWVGSSDEELESAGEGLEKYLMTKIYNRVFMSLPEDVKRDEELSEKITLIQQFIRPEYLDIKPTFQNETSWLANPPHLHSNLLYIQRYRHQSRMVSEAAYFFTNILSAEAFIWDIDAKSLSMDEVEFQHNMESARALLLGLSTDSVSHGDHASEATGHKIEPSKAKNDTNDYVKEQSSAPQAFDLNGMSQRLTSTRTVTDIEKQGTSDLLKEDQLSRYFLDYPFLYARAGDLTIEDVETLLSSYKQLVLKYASLSKGMGISNMPLPVPAVQGEAKYGTGIDSRDLAATGTSSEKEEELTSTDNKPDGNMFTSKSEDNLLISLGEVKPNIPADDSFSRPVIEKDEAFE